MTVGSSLLGGRYRLGPVLGQGGMSVVYQAEDTILGRPVAVKILREQFSGEAEFQERFRREARAAARLSHPNIIAIYDVGRDGDVNYIVMELVEGEDLKALVRRAAPFPPTQIVELGSQIAAALDYAHRAGIVHRDIKSQNVLVTRDGQVKVADFGIAVALGERSITQTGMVIGSVHYMAPEQAQGRPTSPATDIYSLGVVLYEMATGRLPFTAEAPLAVARMHIDTPPVPPQTLNPRLPLAIGATILAALAKRPEARPQSAALVAPALRGQRALAADRTAAATDPRAHDQATRQIRTDRTAIHAPWVADRRAAPGQLRSGRGLGILGFLVLATLLGAFGALAGWVLSGTPNPDRPRPTPAPVIVATSTPLPS
ncbi:MAG: protein kinase, partial [Chloroflexota bacterium]|nr:protein kinase [Chloroflexota bacterium]